MSKEFKFAKSPFPKKRKAESEPEESEPEEEESPDEETFSENDADFLGGTGAAVFDSLESFARAFEAKMGRSLKVPEPGSSEKKDFPPPNKS